MSIFTIADGREAFWQWDKGQRLNIDMTDPRVLGKTVTEINFSNASTAGAIRCAVNVGDDGVYSVSVPNTFFLTGADLLIYAVFVGENDFRTEIREKITVYKRPKPNGYVYTETLGVTDKTLSMSGIAADALATGEAINNLSEQLGASIEEANEQAEKAYAKAEDVERNVVETVLPVFDLVALGLPNVPYGNTTMVIPDESVLTELSEALAKGNVTFIFNCEKEDGSVTAYSVTMTQQSRGTTKECFKIVTYNIADRTFDYVVVAIIGEAIFVGINPVSLGSTEAPSFDLSALGLPNVPYGDASGVYLEADTTEIMEALAKGEVTFAYTAAVGESTTSLAVTVNPILAGGRYICCTYAPMVSELDVIRFIIMEGVIYAVALPVELGGEEVATSIDLSALDSGTIVETYADGTTKTITLEYDEDGNPIKITDGDGNVTELTW